LHHAKDGDMKAELLDRRQTQVGSWDSVDSKDIAGILSQLSPEEDFTLVIQNGSYSLAIAIDHGLYTMMIQLGDDEFYDYFSTFTKADQVEFIEGGQNVYVDKQFLASASTVKDEIKTFGQDPTLVRTNA